MTMPVRATLSCAIALVCCVGLRGQEPVVYNAARGTTPGAQCFAEHGMPAQVVGGMLHVGPTSMSGLSYFSRSDFSIDFDQGFEMEVALRVVSSGCGSGVGNPLRYGIQLSAVDDRGRFFAAHICDSRVALVNTPNGPVDGIDVVATPYPVAGRNLLIRVVADSASATLYVNGAALLSVPTGSYVGPAREFYFGDGTGAAGAEYHVSYCRASGVVPACGATGVVMVSSGCPGLGPMQFAGVVRPGLPVTARFTIPGSGGVPVMLVGRYAMQIPYCTAGCRFGLDPMEAVWVGSAAVSLSLPAMSVLVGQPFAFQGLRILQVGACSTPIDHALTDIAVMTM